MEPIYLHDGRLMQVHDREDCFVAEGIISNCCIHSPSDHPLSKAPLDWSGAIKTMFRKCEHGLLHPDPDDMKFKAISMQFSLMEAIYSVHIDKCDGCCRPKEESL